MDEERNTATEPQPIDEEPWHQRHGLAIVQAAFLAIAVVILIRDVDFGPLRLGNTAKTIHNAGGDIYVGGMLRVDDVLYLDADMDTYFYGASDGPLRLGSPKEAKTLHVREEPLDFYLGGKRIASIERLGEEDVTLSDDLTLMQAPSGALLDLFGEQWEYAPGNYVLTAYVVKLLRSANR